MQISRFVYLKTKLKLVLCQKIRSIIHRIGVQSFILLSQSAQYFCLTAILMGSQFLVCDDLPVYIVCNENYNSMSLVKLSLVLCWCYILQFASWLSIQAVR